MDCCLLMWYSHCGLTSLYMCDQISDLLITYCAQWTSALPSIRHRPFNISRAKKKPSKNQKKPKKPKHSNFYYIVHQHVIFSHHPSHSVMLPSTLEQVVKHYVAFWQSVKMVGPSLNYLMVPRDSITYPYIVLLFVLFVGIFCCSSNFAFVVLAYT